ncbi:MAG: 23S rRNA (guanosine(2251)-2'-O)-methyltransferase RlmB [Pseudomonadota bacterium]|nr:23S rRNA (guanosine(2251)-2'-O)-methyltransferase RlmB [Pseudomonadota bacterium]
MKLKCAYGIHVVTSLLKNKNMNVEKIYLQTDMGKRLGALRDLASQTSSITIFLKSSPELDSLAGTTGHQGIVAYYTENRPFQSLDDILDKKIENLLFLVLDGVVDPHNLGACLRSAAAFNVDAVIIPKDKAVAVTPVVQKVAAGAADLVPVFVETNIARTLEKLAKHNVWIYGLSERADTNLSDYDLSGNIAIVMGGEAKGIRELTAKKCDYLACLPTSSRFPTMNDAVATGITLYEATRARLK